jgi:hypothetical protein
MPALPSIFPIFAACSLVFSGGYLVGEDVSHLHGPALRAALHTQVRGHTVIPYASSRFDTADALRQLDGAIDGTNVSVIRSPPVRR